MIRLALTAGKEVASRIPARFQPPSSLDFSSLSNRMIASPRRSPEKPASPEGRTDPADGIPVPERPRPAGTRRRDRARQARGGDAVRQVHPEIAPDHRNPLALAG